MESSEKNQIKRFLLNMILVISIIFICGFLVGKILSFYYFRQDSGVGHLTNYAIDSTTAEIVILGSSRANHSYIPNTFEDNLDLTCFNAGRDGCYILYNYAVFKAITKRCTPKIIIFDISPGDLFFNSKEYDMLSLLHPYYQTHSEISCIIDLRSPLEKIKHISKIYPFNSLLPQIVAGNLDFNKERITESNKGYSPIYDTINYKAEDTLTYGDGKIDLIKIEALQDIIKTSIENKIKLVFVSSPILNTIPDNEPTSLLLENMCSESGISFMSFLNDTSFLIRPELFADRVHLNNEGAKIFSVMLSERLRGIINSENEEKN